MTGFESMIPIHTVGIQSARECPGDLVELRCKSHEMNARQRTVASGAGISVDRTVGSADGSYELSSRTARLVAERRW